MLYEVVVTAFARYTELEDTLKSINSQSIKPLNIHLIIDGTDSRIENIGKSFGCKVYSLPFTGYPSVGRNYGRTKCNSEFIAFCDDDDVWKEDKMEKQINFLVNNKKINLLYTKARYWDGSKEHGFVSRFSGNIKLAYILFKNPCVFSTLVIRNNQVVKYFNTDKCFKAWEDYYMILESVIGGAHAYILNYDGLKYKINTYNKISKKHDTKRDLKQLKKISNLIISYKKGVYLFIFLPAALVRLIRSYFNEY